MQQWELSFSATNFVTVYMCCSLSLSLPFSTSSSTTQVFPTNSLCCVSFPHSAHSVLCCMHVCFLLQYFSIHLVTYFGPDYTDFSFRSLGSALDLFYFTFNQKLKKKQNFKFGKSTEREIKKKSWKPREFKKKQF